MPPKNFNRFREGSWWRSQQGQILEWVIAVIHIVAWTSTDKLHDISRSLLVDQSIQKLYCRLMHFFRSIDDIFFHSEVIRRQVESCSKPGTEFSCFWPPNFNFWPNFSNYTYFQTWGKVLVVIGRWLSRLCPYYRNGGHISTILLVLRRRASIMRRCLRQQQ